MICYSWNHCMQCEEFGGIYHVMGAIMPKKKKVQTKDVHVIFVSMHAVYHIAVDYCVK